MARHCCYCGGFFASGEQGWDYHIQCVYHPVVTRRITAEKRALEDGLDLVVAAFEAQEDDDTFNFPQTKPENVSTVMGRIVYTAPEPVLILPDEYYDYVEGREYDALRDGLDAVVAEFESELENKDFHWGLTWDEHCRKHRRQQRDAISAVHTERDADIFALELEVQLRKQAQAEAEQWRQKVSEYYGTIQWLQYKVRELEDDSGVNV